jgi:hypothetical protein
MPLSLDATYPYVFYSFYARKIYSYNSIRNMAIVYTIAIVCKLKAQIIESGLSLTIFSHRSLSPKPQAPSPIVCAQAHGMNKKAPIKGLVV